MARKQYTYHYIYKTTCKITEKFYIGMHSTSDLLDGYIGSGKILWYSIKKHGKENHIFEILEHCVDRDSLRLREKEIVNSDLLKDEKCMNMCIGGEGGFKMSKESAITSGKKWLTWHLENLKTNIEYRNKFTKAMSDTRFGDKNPFYGHSHTLEAREKIRKITSKSQKGSGNSQYGKMWIHRNGVNMSIKKDQFIQYASDGWSKGRKF